MSFSGGFRYGSAAQYDAETFAKEGVIVVPVQYRLGTLGIIGDSTKEFNGNLAMFDMTAALRWVTEYISFFGGDPKQIKVMGQGSGAASAMYMSMSQLPRSGSINGVVSMSGSALAQYAKDEEPVQSLEEIASINKCPTTNETAIVSCMRARSVEDLVMSDSMVQTERLQGRAMVKGLSGGVAFNPHKEEQDDNRGLPGFLTEEPAEQIMEKRLPEIPLLIGVTKEETGNAISLQVVEQIFGSAEKFLNSLLDIAVIGDIKKLLNVDAVTGKILQPNLPGLGQLNLGLGDLLKVPPNLNPFELLKKLTETTTDVLFNLPAVLSAENWGKKAPAFLYSFEHRGKVSNGFNFLRGLPVVKEDKNYNFTSHGDDLGYIFKCNDIFGNPIKGAELKSEEDKKVQKNMIDLLIKFSKISNTSDVAKDGFLPSFGMNKGVPYIKVTEKLEVLENFRFCELSLWGAPLEAVKSTTCEGLGKTLSAVTGALGKVTGGLSDSVTGGLSDSVSGGLGGLTGGGLGGLTGLSGGGGGGNKRPNSGGPLGLFG